MTKLPLKILFFGTPPFAAEILAYLIAQGVQVVAVVTKPDRPKGRSGTPVPTPVKEVALRHNIPVYQPPLVSDPAFAPTLQAYEADLFIVAAYGEILKQHLLDMPKKGCINVHPSLLPKYRGATPIQSSILAGDTETGVTIMHMAKKMDAGDIIDVVKMPIGPDTTYGELESALCKAGSEALLKVLHTIANNTATRTPQDPALATFSTKIELENCEIHWENASQAIHNLIRGVNPEPGAWCYVTVKGQKLRLKVFTSKLEHNQSGKPGEILHYGKGGMVIATGQGAIRLLQVQLEGKKAMSSEELSRGILKEQFHL